MQRNNCTVCGNEIKIQCRKGTEVCSENCDKKLKGEIPIAPQPIESEGHHASE